MTLPKLPDWVKKEAASFWHTFAATLVVAIGAQLSSGQVPATKDAAIALATAVVRVALKAAFNAIFAD